MNTLRFMQAFARLRDGELRASGEIDDAEYDVREVKRLYMAGDIDADELERGVEQALQGKKPDCIPFSVPRMTTVYE